jgi:hypothetical protein
VAERPIEALFAIENGRGDHRLGHLDFFSAGLPNWIPWASGKSVE